MITSMFPHDAVFIYFKWKPASVLKKIITNADIVIPAFADPALLFFFFFYFKCLCRGVFLKSRDAYLGWSCMSWAYQQQEGAWRRSCDFSAKVTPSGSGALQREVNGRSKVSELVFTKKMTGKPTFHTVFWLLCKLLCKCLELGGKKMRFGGLHFFLMTYLSVIPDFRQYFHHLAVVHVSASCLWTGSTFRAMCIQNLLYLPVIMQMQPTGNNSPWELAGCMGLWFSRAFPTALRAEQGESFSPRCLPSAFVWAWRVASVLSPPVLTEP